MLEKLKNQKMLFKLHSYAGWNTATNSTGSALSTGILAKKMSSNDKNQLLFTRYLDDWAYQANIRNIVSAQLNWINGEGYYNSLDEKKYDAAAWCEQMLTYFVKNNFSEVRLKDKIRVQFPWNRMFESEISFE